jgi:hypothetical protein
LQRAGIDVVRRELVGDSVAATSSSATWQREGLIGVATGGHWRRLRRGRRREGSSGSGVGCGQIGQNDFGGGERGYCCSNIFSRVIFLQLPTPLCRVFLKDTAVDSLAQL